MCDVTSKMFTFLVIIVFIKYDAVRQSWDCIIFVIFHDEIFYEMQREA